jgi:hypothetical protein
VLEGVIMSREIDIRPAVNKHLFQTHARVKFSPRPHVVDAGVVVAAETPRLVLMSAAGCVQRMVTKDELPPR